MKRIFMIAALLTVGLSAWGQTTNTNCTTVGNQTNCTSTTQAPPPDYTQAGNALGEGIGRMIANHRAIKNYCKFHPGEDWQSTNGSSGHCKVPKGTYQAPETAETASFTGPSRFVADSPGAQEWCSHQPLGMTYGAMDGYVHKCSFTPDSTVAKEWCSHSKSSLYPGTDNVPHYCVANLPTLGGSRQ
jgi:hypothetical protein